MQDSAQALADTLAAVVAVADSSAQEIAREAFVGDPVRQGVALLAFVGLIVLGFLGAVWILGRKKERDQAALTKAGVAAFCIAISLWIWQAGAASFLGIGDFQTVNDFGWKLIALGTAGAGVVKAGSTVIAREQVKQGKPVRGAEE